MSNGLFLRQLTGMSMWIKPIQHWCRWTSTCFLLTLYNSLKNFLSGISNAIFFTSSFFNAFFSKKWTLGARPVDKINTKFCLFMSRCSVFFFHLGTFLQEKSEAWRKPPFKEFRTRVEEHWRVHWQDSRSLIIFGLYVSDFWMSSWREPTCPLFWLK